VDTSNSGPLASFGFMAIPIKDTEEVIRELCIVAATAEGEDFKQAISELSIALREHTTNSENLVLSMLLDTRKPKP
jgi:hypothetical protein